MSLDSDLTRLTEAVGSLAERLKFTEQMVHLQNAQIQALLAYSAALVDMAPVGSREEAREKLGAMIRGLYAEHIDLIQKDNPAMAARVDVRAGLSEKDQEKWYLAWYPKPDASGETEPPKG